MKNFLLLATVAAFAFGGDLEDGLKAYANSDFELATKKFNAACDKQDKLGCEKLGAMYQAGKNLTEDKNYALQAYLKACELGSGKGCSGAAGLYTGGNDDKAQELFRKACELGEGYACGVVGSYLIDKQQFKEANAFFVKSCKLGDKLGCEFSKDLVRSKRL